MLPTFEALVAQATAQTKPYCWFVKQSKCRACGEVHEMQPVLMREERSGWWLQCNEPMEDHANAPLKFEVVELAWCKNCHSEAARLLTADVKLACDSFANTTALAGQLEKLLYAYYKVRAKEHFHHA
jgi:hypothetical protein